MRELVKSLTGHAAAVLPQCRYDKCIFILAHMRCGSTALSNIFCTRPDVSGYGECHVKYTGQASLGRLVVNQSRRGGWTPKAEHLFDKILHNRHDEAAPDAFFTARAVFVAREPVPAIRSIRKLYEGIGRDEYGDDVSAAEYYVERVNALIGLWDRFPEHRRVGLTHSMLISDPEAELDRISKRLDLQPPLENRYESLAASRKGGAGDPTASGKYNRIERRASEPGKVVEPLEIPDALNRQAEEAYARFVATVLS